MSCIQNSTTQEPTPLAAGGVCACPELQCRELCGACCIAPSISSLIPPPPEGYPSGYVPLPGGGKPAGVPCPQLDERLRCRLFGKPERPRVCVSLRPCFEMCGQNRDEALQHLGDLEKQTAP